MKLIAFETANSYVKVFAGGDKVVVYPNTLRPAPREFLYNKDTKVYTIDGQSYLIGHTRDYISSAGKGEDRYLKPAFYHESLIALSHFVENGDVIHASTGLPSIHYTKKNIETLKKLFIKRHTLKVNDKEVSFEIKALDVILQPLGSFFYSTVDEHGNKRSLYDKLMKGDVLVIDIGFGSTDLAEVSNSALIDYQEGGSAMLDAYLDLIARMKQKYSGTPLETADIKPLRLESETRNSDIFLYSNNPYPIGQLKEDVFNLHAQKIIYHVTTLKDLSKYDYVIFTGGGIELLKPYLHRYVDKTNAVVISEAQVANVKGFYVYSLSSKVGV
jgi:hypothetical protein